VSRNEGAAGAAAVSQMLGGRALADIIEGARKHFLYVSANKLTKEDMAKLDAFPQAPFVE